MKALLALFFLLFASRAPIHNEKLRANQFNEPKPLSPWLIMLTPMKDRDDQWRR